MVCCEERNSVFLSLELWGIILRTEFSAYSKKFQVLYHVIQLHRICNIFADSVSALLVRLQPEPEAAELIHCRCFLHLLRLVGLAFPVSHRFHIVLQLGKRSAD